MLAFLMVSRFFHSWRLAGGEGADNGKYWAAGQVVRVKERIDMPGDEETLLEESSLEETLGEKSLQHILQSMLQSIENSKGQIFDIYEEARNEVEISKRNLAEVKRQANEVIDEVDALEAEEQKEKQRLVRASSRFTDYSEEKIQQAYEAVKMIQVQLGIAREKERQLRQQRNQMELRLQHLRRTVVAAERLAMRISSMLSFLGSQISDVVAQMEEASKSRFLSAAIIRGQEEERFRVSREIHDGPAQEIANLIMEASVVERLVDIDPDEAKLNLQEMRRHMRSCMSGIRQIVFDMRPMALDDLGFLAAVEQLIRRYKERDMLDVQLAVEGRETPVPPHIKTGLFRIVQEAMNNVLHHAGVKKAALRIHYAEPGISLLLEDRGKGFDVEMLHRQGASATGYEHFGILGMQERAAIIGAQLTVTSAPGRGTKVHVRLPLQPAPAPTLGETIQKVMGKPPAKGQNAENSPDGGRA